MICVLALVSFPVPFSPVPFTLQVLGIYLAASILGPVYGASACAIYLLLGLVGLPVYAGATAGPTVLFGPLGGYLVSYPVAALAGGFVARVRSSSAREDAIRVLLCCALSIVIIYVIGVVWLSVYLGLGAYEGFLVGVVPFVPLDALKAIVAVAIASRVRRARVPLPLDWAESR
jgi:biotin transport system substrate-specific component